MLFSSPSFFAFFVVYFCLHLVVPTSYRILIVIGGSTIFYAWWRLEYAWLPYLLMAVAYAGVLWMEHAVDQAGRKWRATATIVALFVPLLVFKYTNFVYRDVLGPFLNWSGSLLDLPLPLGVSFITFTLAAYIVDTYRGRFPVGRRASTVLAYVLFFPHLIAGPILRPHELIPQLERPRAASLRRLAFPLAIFTVGLVKKLVFADQIADVVDAIYRQGGSLASGPVALLAIYGFSVQIYCDFSGYTDMAIGLALLLGVRLPNNFRQPYAARSIVDFWRRWHITLSFWLRDYLYIPLGGSRNGRLQEMRNIIVTMALGGLWHGANWTFVIWGVLHGVGVSAVHAIGRLRAERCVRGSSSPERPSAHLPEGAVVRYGVAGGPPIATVESAQARSTLGPVRVLPGWLAVLITFHFVTFGWVFVRAPRLTQAMDMLAAPFTGGWGNATSVLSDNVFPCLLVAVFFLGHRFDDHRRIRLAVRYVRAEILWPILLLLWILAITVSQGSSAKFIYFDF